MALLATTRCEGQNITLTLAGRMYSENAYAMENNIAPCLTVAAPKVMVDMGKVTYMDAAGISSLVRLHKTVAASGGQLKLTGLSGIVKDLFFLCQLDHVIDFE